MWTKDLSRDKSGGDEKFSRHHQKLRRKHEPTWKLLKSSNLHIPKSIRLKRLNYPSGEIKKPRNGGLMVWKSFNLPQFPTWARISDSFSREIILTLRKIIRKRISSPSKIEFKRAEKFSQKCRNLKERNTYISTSHA